MFTTLVESRAIRRRSTRGAVMSVIVHTLVIASAVALTHPRYVDASPDDGPRPIVFVPAPVLRPMPGAPGAPTPPSAPTPPIAPVLLIPVPAVAYTSLPPIDLDGPSVPEEKILIGGGVSALPPGTGSTGAFSPTIVLDASVVDRMPHITGNPTPPRYPDMLRQGGATGQVVVRFVVDTLGRAELGDLTIVEATHPLFASAVKTALMGYRFTPGEAAGRKVRTLVQIPFSFTLK